MENLNVMNSNARPTQLGHGRFKKTDGVQNFVCQAIGTQKQNF